MPQFLVRALNERGHWLHQPEDAATEKELRERLLQQGYQVYSIQPRHGVFDSWRRRQARVRQDVFLTFNQQFITLIHAGLPILRAVELLAKRARDPKLQRLLTAVLERIRGGDLLSEAFRRQPSVPEIYTTTLMAGERSGNLEEVLKRYHQYQRLAQSIRRKLTSSLVYPCFLLVMVLVVLIFLVTFVVPRFAKLYGSLGAQLPTMTVYMLDFGEAAKHYFWALPLGLILVVAALALLVQKTPLGTWIDAAFLRAPVVGELWWKYQAALLARTLGTLLLGGIPLPAALDTAGTALRSRRLREGLRDSTRRVREGRQLSDALSEHKVLPSLAVEMVEVGEGTGALPQMLASVAEFYDEDLSTVLTTLLSLLEPLILIVVGTIVAAVLISLYLPIFSLGSQIH
ncbi:MAG: type II secretion system F family protein [Terriglobales bacterium]